MSEVEWMKSGALLEVVLERTNMQLAWSAVERNDGSAGVDRKNVAMTQAHLVNHWSGIAEKLRSGVYQPAAILAVSIPKASGGERQLGIPTVQDRLIQQGLLQVLSPLFEPTMSMHSYGFRPGRSAHDAVRAASAYVSSGKAWVVDIDLKNFFDQVDHDKLMHRVGQVVRDKRVLQLIGRYLRSPLQDRAGTRQTRTRGTPQGGPLSPLLANIYLTPLDQELERRGISFVRYADDIQLYASSERSAQRMLEGISGWIAKHLKLEVNVAKSGTGPTGGTQLLGFTIQSDGATWIAGKAVERLKEKVRAFWTARVSRPLQQLKQQWAAAIRGWWNYFREADRPYAVRRLTGWIRRHMRKYLWQRWHNRKGRRNALYRLGIRGRSLRLASCSRGAWHLSRHAVINQALSNQMLQDHGYLIPWTSASASR